jgi:SNF2 family DNA or RNA helicase
MEAVTEKYVKPPVSIFYYHDQTKKTATSKLVGNCEAVLATYETLTPEWLSCEECVHDFADRAKGKTCRVIDSEGGRRMVDLIEVRRSLPLIGMQWGRVVLDEGHRVRNEDKSIASTVRSPLALKRVVSTGTPFQNEYTNLRSIFVFLRIEPWNERLFFKEHFLLTKRGKRSTSSKAILKGWRNNVLSFGLEGFWVRRPRGEHFENFDISNTIPTIQKVE